MAIEVSCGVGEVELLEAGTGVALWKVTAADGLEEGYRFHGR